MDSDAELRALVDERVAAVHAKDLTPLRDRVHPDIVSYNLLPPSRTAGATPVEAAARRWFDGYPGTIGYDVHDMVRRPEILAPNMVFCVDIGVYHEEWGIGFRLEDNCLITEDGCENLSAAIPRTIEDIEVVMRGEA